MHVASGQDIAGDGYLYGIPDLRDAHLWRGMTEGMTEGRLKEEGRRKEEGGRRKKTPCPYTSPGPDKAAMLAGLVLRDVDTRPRTGASQQS
jgi:hypothetical protein